MTEPTAEERTQMDRAVEALKRMRDGAGGLVLPPTRSWLVGLADGSSLLVPAEWSEVRDDGGLVLGVTTDGEVRAVLRVPAGGWRFVAEWLGGDDGVRAYTPPPGRVELVPGKPPW